MIKKILRKPYREILKRITKKVIEKHHPKIIVIVGDGHTSIARELVYEVVRSNYPARRNLESPEAEFSVPLTIIGYPKYPVSAIQWVWVLAKAYYNVRNLQPYSHFLVLELNFITEKLMTDWLEITRPETILIVGKIPFDYSKYDFKKIIKISASNAEDVLIPFRIAAKQIGRFYNVSEEDIQTVFDTFTLPPSKIRYYLGKNGSTILDATHYYFPIKLESVLEMVDQKTENLVLFSDIPQDYYLVKGNQNINLNPINYRPVKDDLIIIRGEKSKSLVKYENLIANSVPSEQ